MPSTWPSIRLGNHVDLITGFPFKSKRFTSGSGDIHLVKGENLQQGYIDWGASKKWPSSELKGHEKFLLQPGDVVLAMDRPWVPAGLKHARIRKGDPISLLVQRVARIRGSNGLLTSYLQYVIASPRFTD